MASSRMPSFLKKIGSDNIATLHIPSSFVKSQCRRLSATLTLEGPSTEKWTVTAEGKFSKCNVSLGQGWTNFVADHHLQLGDQLMFLLTGESYFLVEVYDESGCQKLSALDAINSAAPLDSNGTNDTPPEFEAKPKPKEGDKSSKVDVGFSPAKKPAAQHKQKKSSASAKVSPVKKAAISLSSSDSEQDAPSSSLGKQLSEKLRTNGKRGRGKSSQEFFQDVEEEDFSLFHKPRARSTSKRSAAGDAAEAVKRLSAKKKPAHEEVALPMPQSKGHGRLDKVGHGFLRCHFVIDGSLEDPLHAVEAS